MGKELEYKLGVPGKERLDEILQDEIFAALGQGEWKTTPMRTTYYDTEARIFAAHDVTLRHRMEGMKSIVCVKTPLKESHARGEWEIPAPAVDGSAIEKLLRKGAPQELLALYASGMVLPVCSAEFVRRSRMLRFEDGSLAELAGDTGILRGQTETLAFSELELELYGGEPAAMKKLADMLCKKYGIREQPMSKYARAKRLK